MNMRTCEESGVEIQNRDNNTVPAGLFHAYTQDHIASIIFLLYITGFLNFHIFSGYMIF